jgi:single-stranded-DNA-specific exonuclease
VVGIVAGRLADRYERPAIVIGFENGVGRGSVRGPEGSQLYTAVSATASVLVRYGGHESAAGLEIELARLCELREAFDAACAAGLAAPGVVADGCVAPRGRRPELVWLDPDDDPGRVLADLALLEPCGERNPAARIAIDAGIVAAREVRGGHLKLELELTRGRRIAAFGPGLGARAGELQGRAVVVGRLRPDRWRGGNAVEVKIEAIP